MDRRAFLTAAGAVALAGCAGAGGDPGDGGDPDSGSDGGTDGEPTDDTDDDPIDDTDGEPADGGTDAGSDGPELDSRDFARTGDCTDAGSATIDFGDEAVRVTGCIRGSDGCMQAALSAATYDRDADRFRVVVETVDESGPDQACTQALVDRGYEAAFGFSGGLPGTVVVIHDAYDGRSEVARKRR